jgi:hypothetical protein
MASRVGILPWRAMCKFGRVYGTQNAEGRAEVSMCESPGVAYEIQISELSAELDELKLKYRTLRELYSAQRTVGRWMRYYLRWAAVYSKLTRNDNLKREIACALGKPDRSSYGGGYVRKLC